MSFVQKLRRGLKQLFHVNTIGSEQEHYQLTTSKLASEIHREFPQLTQRQCNLWAGITGLLCRVAFVDVNISIAEKEQLIKSLQLFLVNENAIIVRALAEMGVSHMQTWAGIEGHLYCDHLKNELGLEDKRKILDALFVLAGSDGNADNQETEEIRTIARGLLLEDREYYSARARHKDLLGALRSE